MADPYLAFALLIHAGLDGVIRKLSPPAPKNINLHTAEKALTDTLDTLPLTGGEAEKYARTSEFVKEILPENYIDTYGKFIKR